MKRYEFEEKVKNVHGDKYIYRSYVISGVEQYNLPSHISHTDRLIIEYMGVTYSQTISKHLMGRCPEMNIVRKTTSQFIKEARDYWGDKYDYSLTEYKGALKKVKIIFEGIIYEQVAASHLSGMSIEKKMNRESFIKRSKEIYGDVYDYTNVKYVACNIPVLIGYNNILYLQKPQNHLNGHRPENKPLSVRKTTGKFVCESNLIHDYVYMYDKVEYKRNNLKVTIICPTHGDFEQTPRSHLGGSGCPKCSWSIGEKYISRFLERYNISYYTQHKFEDCVNILPLPFDFYIPSMGMCIEFDGIQHFQPITFFGGQDRYVKLKKNDSIKNEYCEDNYINLLRIRYDEVDEIDSILWNALGYHIRRLGLN
jgi:very-short-patch-repair endonuclease